MIHLSIIVPVFNEEKTIRQIIRLLLNVDLKNTKKEIIIVNDASTDKTGEYLTSLQKKYRTLKIYHHKKNLGKGAAVKTGARTAKGDYLLIQDADLEYDPKYIKLLLESLLNREGETIYGTRYGRFHRLPNFSGEERTVRFFIHYLGNRFLSLLTSLLYGVWISDMETCYKLFPKKHFMSLSIHARGFEFEPEITAKFLKKKYTIKEVPIKTSPRGYEDGKKLDTIKDGTKAMWALIKYRFVD